MGVQARAKGGTAESPIQLDAKNAALKKRIRDLEAKLGAMKNKGLAGKGQRTPQTPTRNEKQLAFTDITTEGPLKKRWRGGEDQSGKGWQRQDSDGTPRVLVP